MIAGKISMSNTQIGYCGPCEFSQADAKGLPAILTTVMGQLFDVSNRSKAG
jgi:hypothetical protein